MTIHKPYFNPGLFVLLIALLPRILFLPLIEFKADEALTVSTLKQFVHKPYIITTGLSSSIKIKNFPLFTYLLIPFSLISTHPLFLSAVIAVVNTLAIFAFYLITHQYYPKSVALTAALVWAVSPNAILFSRKIWAQDLIPLFAVPIYGLLLHLANRRPSTNWLIPILVSLLLLQGQLHASGWFIALPIMYWLIKHYPKQLVTPYLFLGIIISLLPAIPYIYDQFTSKSFFSSYASIYLASSSSYLDFAHLFKWLTLTSSFAVRFINPLVFILQLIGLYQLWLNRYKKDRSLLFVIVCILPLIYLLAQVPYQLSYYQVIFPYLALSLGLLFTRLKIGVYLFIIIVNLGYTVMYFHRLNQNIVIDHQYGLPYKFTQKLASAVLAPYLNHPDYDKLWLIVHFQTENDRFPVDKGMHYRLAKYFFDQKEMELSNHELYYVNQ